MHTQKHLPFSFIFYGMVLM